MIIRNRYIAKSAVTFIVGLSQLSMAISAQAPLQLDKTRYRLVQNWPQFQSEQVLGQPSGLGLDSQNNLYVFHRANGNPEDGKTIAQNTIAKFHAETGLYLGSWGAGIFVWPHGLTIDHEDNIWVSDIALHQVFKFSPEGKLLLKVGEAMEVGDDENHFNKPTDVAVAKDGSFYVSDGYGNSRIVKFSPSGKFLFQWGEKGSAEGQFNLPHSLDMDKEENIIVADRENARIQKFDRNGKFLGQLQNHLEAKVYAVQYGEDPSLIYAIDYKVDAKSQPVGSKLLVFDANLSRDHNFEFDSHYIIPICRYHDIEIDENQNVYVIDLLNNLIQKFTPIKFQ